MKKIVKLTENQLKQVIENVINEQYTNSINLTDGQVNYYNQLWNNIDIKYTNNSFWKSIMKKVNKTKKLTKKQKWFLDFLFNHGKSPYEAGVLPSNY